VGGAQGTCLSNVAAVGGSIFEAPRREHRPVTKRDIIRAISEETGLTQRQAQQIVLVIVVLIV
jgi:hypothetical protein